LVEDCRVEADDDAITLKAPPQNLWVNRN